MNRRRFLYTGAALTAVATNSISARSYAAIAGANDRLRLGVIGLGRRATEVCKGFNEDPRLQIVALADIYDKQAAEFQAALKDHIERPTVMVEYQRMLENKDVDAVFIATPDHLHVQMAKDALEAGKHVYLEKPTLHRWIERDTLIQAAAGSKAVLQCGMQQRSGAHYMRAKQEIFDTHSLGKVVLVRAVWHNFPWQRRDIPNQPKPAGLNWELFLGPAPRVPYETARYSSWRSYHSYGNGLLADILTHWVDVAQWMLEDDRPLSAAALGGDFQLRDDRDNPDTVSAVLRYKDWNLNFESSVLSIRNDHPSVFFEGTNGTLDLTREGYTLTPNHGAPVEVDSRQNLEIAHTANFINAVVNGDKVNAPLAVGLSASLPVQMALQSYWSHQLSTPDQLSSGDANAGHSVL
jgi:predicted dehydrogenase